MRVRIQVLRQGDGERQAMAAMQQGSRVGQDEVLECNASTRNINGQRQCKSMSPNLHRETPTQQLAIDTDVHGEVLAESG